MIEKRYIIDTDCLMNMVLDTRFGFYGLDEPTEQEIMDKDYLVVCTVHSDSEAKEVCERLNQYEDKIKEIKRNYDLCVHRRMDDSNKVYELEEENKKLKAKLKELQE